MANLGKVIYINEEDYSTLLNGGSITKGGTTYTYDSTALYVIKDVSAPEYAETAGYATTAGQATKAIQDGGGNVITATYDKKPLVIEVDDTDTSVPSGTYASITAALAAGRDVMLKVIATEDEDQIEYLRFVEDYNSQGWYYFGNRTYFAEITENERFSCDFVSANNHTHGNVTSDGELQNTDITIANGDKLVVTDASNSNKVARASLTFDGSTTTQALTKKGTWETFGEKTLIRMTVSGTTPSFTDANYNNLTHAQVITLLQDKTKDVVIDYGASLFICNYDDGSFYFGSVQPDEQRVECFSLYVAQDNSLTYTHLDDVYLVTNAEKTTWNNKADKLKNIVIVKSGTSPNYTYSLPIGVTAASIATDITTNGTTVVLSLDDEIYYYDRTTGSSSSTVLHFKYVDTTADGVVEKDLAIAYSNNAVTLTTTTADLSSKVSKVTSTDNAIARFDGTGGQIQNSGVTINDSNHVTAAKFITSGGTSSQFVAGDGSLKTIDTAVSNSSTNVVTSKAIADYIVSRDENLVTNGFASLGTNYNFSGLTLDTADTYTGGGSFCLTSNSSLNTNTNEFIPVDIAQPYKLKYFVKNTYSTSTYDYLDMYDVDKLGITYSHCNWIAGSTTTLAQDLNNGDTVVHLTDVSGFTGSGSATTGFIVWNYRNSGGYQYPVETYSRNTWAGLWDDISTAKDVTNNTITLKSAWTHGTIVAGTSLSQRKDGNTYEYGNTSYYPTAGEWVEKTYTFRPSRFRAGTAYVRIGWLINYSKVANNKFAISGISLTAHPSYEDIFTPSGTSSQFVKGDGSLDSTTYTPQTSAGANSLLSSLPDWTAVPTDTTKLVRRDTGGSASFGQVTFLTVWNYIKSKISSVLGIGGDNGVPTAPTAASGTNTTQVATTAFVQDALSNMGAGGSEMVDVTITGTTSSASFSANPYNAIKAVVDDGKIAVLNASVAPLSTTGVLIPVYEYTYSLSGSDFTGYKGKIQNGNYEISVDVQSTSSATVTISDLSEKEIFWVNCTFGNPPSLDKTYADISTAIGSGKEVILNVASGMLFLRYVHGGDPRDIYFTNIVVENGEAVVYTLSLTSQNVITVGTVSLGLPSVTSSDNGKVLKVVNGAWGVAEDTDTDTQQTLISMDIEEETKSGSSCYFNDASGNELTHAQVSALIEDKTKDIVIIHTPNEDSGQAYFRQNGYFANIKGGTKSLSNGAKVYFVGYAQGDSKWYNITLTWNNNAFTAECVAIGGGSGSGISFYYVDKAALPWVFYDIDNNIVDHSTILAALYKNPASLVFATDTDLGERAVLRYNSNDFGLGSYTGSSPYEPTMISIIEFGDRNDTLTCDYSEYTFAQSRSLTVTINGTIASPSFAANPYQDVYELAHYGNLPVLNANINPLSMSGVQIPVYSYTYQVSGTNYTGYKGFIQKGNYEISVDIKESGSTVTITSVGSSITVDTALSESSTNPVQNRVITAQILENEEIVATALNNLNDRVELKQDQLVSGTTIKTINNQSILGSGNISISGGGGGGGEENVIETVKVNGTALTPDANKAVNVQAITGVTVGNTALTPSNGVITIGVDTTPTANSTNVVLSGGIKSYVEKDYVVWKFSYKRNDSTSEFYYDTTGYKYSDIASILSSGKVLHIRIVDEVDGLGEERLFVDMSEISSGYNAFDIQGMAGAFRSNGILPIYYYVLSEGSNDSITVTQQNYSSHIRYYNNQLQYDEVEIATVNDVSSKQDALVSGTNIKTVNNNSLLGSGNISVGTYSKPSGGIPKTDLASAVQTSLGKADTALQPDVDNDLAQGTISSSNSQGFDYIIANKSTSSEQTLQDALDAKASTSTVNAKYTKPSGGIPYTDLSTAVAQRLLPEGNGSIDDGKIVQYSYTGGGWQLVKPITIYTGSTAPSSGTGSNGDIYIQTS